MAVGSTSESTQERAHRATRWISNITSALGSFPAILAAVGVVVLWAVSYPLWKDGNTWLLIINTITTIVTFIMVFVIQNTTNRDGKAVHAKLDEILEAVDELAKAINGTVEHEIRGAPDKVDLVGIEDRPEREVDEVHDRVKERVESSKDS